MSHARVVEVLTHPDGRAAGVAYLKDGRRHVVRARVVVLGAYTYENVRLLLLSRSTAHPARPRQRLRPGRPALRHARVRVQLRLVRRPRAQHLDGHDVAGGDASTTSTPTTSTTPDCGFVGGGTMIAMMEKKLLLFSRMAPPTVARWGADFKRWLARDFRSVGHVHYFVDELPHEDSYLDLDPTHTDPDGLPVIRVTRASQPEDVAQMRFVAERSQEWLLRGGRRRDLGAAVPCLQRERPRLRWRAYGRRPGDQRGRSLRHGPRGSEPRAARRQHVSDEHRIAPHGDDGGARLANRGAHRRTVVAARAPLRRLAPSRGSKTP